MSKTWRFLVTLSDETHDFYAKRAFHERRNRENDVKFWEYFTIIPRTL